MSARTPRHADRAGLPLWVTASLTACVVVALAVAGQTAAQGRLGAETASMAGAGIGLLAMVGLPSLSIRLVARTLLLVSAAVLVRFGVLVGSLASGGQFVLLWMAAAVGVLVLTDRIGTDAALPLQGDGAPAARSRMGPTARTIALLTVVAVVVAVVLTPLLLPHVGQPTEAGDGASLDALDGGAGALRASDSLDMTERPDLTDEVVFTVDADRGTFWRGQTFDTWDGRRWTRSDPRFQPLATSERLQIAPEDLGARGPDVVEQRVRIETSFAEVVHAAASAVEVQIDRPVRQRADGTLQSVPLGRGATYTVVSRREPLSDERLRSVDGGEIPAAVLEQYAQPPVATDRVRAVAAEIVADAPTQYDAILALQDWMGERVEYSLEAPLAPKGVDVVDHFLFEAEEGWCEQVASSLVVLARQNGIPARLVTGFVPGERDPVTGVFTVRERDAHAWAEVWFPEVGWVPFDPTADVPLAGDDGRDPTVGEWLLDHAVAIGLGLVALGLLVGPVRAFVRRRLATRRARPVGWVAVTDARLDRLGQRAELSRRPDQSASAYAAALAHRYSEPRLAAVGVLIDDALYADLPPAAAARSEADALLDALADAPVPQPVAV